MSRGLGGLTDLLGYDAGVRIVVRPFPREEVPWHRKKRLAKKWRKRRGPKWRYLPVDVREILHDRGRGVLYCSPPMERELRRLLAYETEAQRCNDVS